MNFRTSLRPNEPIRQVLKENLILESRILTHDEIVIYLSIYFVGIKILYNHNHKMFSFNKTPVLSSFLNIKKKRLFILQSINYPVCHDVHIYLLFFPFLCFLTSRVNQ